MPDVRSFALAVAAALLLGGCTLTLPAMTEADQVRARSAARLSVDEVEALERNAPVVVRLMGGEAFEADYLGVGPKLGAPAERVVRLAVGPREVEVPAGEVRWIRPVQRSNVLPAAALGAAIDAAMLFAMTRTSLGIGLQW